MIKLIRIIILAMLSSSILAGITGCQSSPKNSYAPFGASAYNSNPETVVAPAQISSSPSGGGTCSHCQ